MMKRHLDHSFLCES